MCSVNTGIKPHKQMCNQVVHTAEDTGLTGRKAAGDSASNVSHTGQSMTSFVHIITVQREAFFTDI